MHFYANYLTNIELANSDAINSKINIHWIKYNLKKYHGIYFLLVETDNSNYWVIRIAS